MPKFQQFQKKNSQQQNLPFDICDIIALLQSANLSGTLLLSIIEIVCGEQTKQLDVYICTIEHGIKPLIINSACASIGEKLLVILTFDVSHCLVVDPYKEKKCKQILWAKEEETSLLEIIAKNSQFLATQVSNLFRNAHINTKHSSSSIKDKFYNV